MYKLDAIALFWPHKCS